MATFGFYDILVLRHFGLATFVIGNNLAGDFGQTTFWLATFWYGDVWDRRHSGLATIYLAIFWSGDILAGDILKCRQSLTPSHKPKCHRILILNEHIAHFGTGNTWDGDILVCDSGDILIWRHFDVATSGCDINFWSGDILVEMRFWSGDNFSLATLILVCKNCWSGDILAWRHFDR